jgi:hypothetical protein
VAERLLLRLLIAIDLNYDQLARQPKYGAGTANHWFCGSTLLGR